MANGNQVSMTYDGPGCASLQQSEMGSLPFDILLYYYDIFWSRACYPWKYSYEVVTQKSSLRIKILIKKHYIFGASVQFSSKDIAIRSMIEYKFDRFYQVKLCYWYYLIKYAL